MRCPTLQGYKRCRSLTNGCNFVEFGKIEISLKSDIRYTWIPLDECETRCWRYTFCCSILCRYYSLPSKLLEMFELIYVILIIKYKVNLFHQTEYLKKFFFFKVLLSVLSLMFNIFLLLDF